NRTLQTLNVSLGFGQFLLGLVNGPGSLILSLPVRVVLDLLQIIFCLLNVSLSLCQRAGSLTIAGIGITLCFLPIHFSLGDVVSGLLQTLAGRVDQLDLGGPDTVVAFHQQRGGWADSLSVRCVLNIDLAVDAVQPD